MGDLERDGRELSARQQYRTLLAVSEAIVSHRDLATLFHDLAGRLHLVVHFDYLACTLHDATSNTMRPQGLSHRRPRAWCTARTLCLAKLRVSPAATACNEVSCAAGHGRLFTVATVRTCPPPLRKSPITPHLWRWEIRCGGALLRCGTAPTRVLAWVANQPRPRRALLRCGTAPTWVAAEMDVNDVVNT
jgi:hypothetical protein